MYCAVDKMQVKMPHGHEMHIMLAIL